jgi:uncharacterized membrane protein YdjX (TVP38/TMEM64 family)
MPRPVPWRMLLLVVAVALVSLGLWLLPVAEWLRQFIDWVKDLGPWGPVLLALFYIPASLLFLPGFILTMGAGLAFGLVIGTITVSIGSTLAAAAAFWLGRTLARGLIEKQIAGNLRFQALDHAVAREGFKIVLLTRLSPIFPFNLQNYVYGLTRVRFRDYLLASWLGMLPATILYVYLGQAFQTLTKPEEYTVPQILFLTVGLAATILVTILVTRLARRALSRTAPEILSIHKDL